VLQLKEQAFVMWWCAIW